MASFTFVREVGAPPEVVFDVLTDHRGYAEITPLRKSVLEREGVPAPNGVGAIRAVSAIGPPLREEVIVYERPTRFSYKVLSGAPIRDHLGTVSFEPNGDGTRIVYAVKMIPTVPLIGGLVVGLTKLGIGLLLNGATSKAERHAAAGA